MQHNLSLYTPREFGKIAIVLLVLSCFGSRATAAKRAAAFHWLVIAVFVAIYGVVDGVYVILDVVSHSSTGELLWSVVCDWTLTGLTIPSIVLCVAIYCRMPLRIRELLVVTKWVIASAAVSLCDLLLILILVFHYLKNYP